MAKIPFQNPIKPSLRIVESILQDTPNASVALKPGPVRVVVASGDVTRAKADTAPNARFFGIIIHRVPGNMPTTAIREGVVDGYDFTNVNYDADIYLDNDGDLSTTPGTIVVRVGRVIAMKGNKPGQPRFKALAVEYKLSGTYVAP